MENIFLSFSKDINQTDIIEFQNMATKKKFDKDDYFITENRICNQLAFCLKGGFKYFVRNDDREHIKDFVFENTFFTAFTSFTLQEPSEIYIQALENSEILTWPYKTVNEWISEKKGWQEFGRKIAEQLYIRKEKREIAFLKNNAEERYQQFLLDFPKVNQRVHQYLIASYLGISQEHLSRIRGK